MAQCTRCGKKFNVTARQSRSPASSNMLKIARVFKQDKSTGIQTVAKPTKYIENQNKVVLVCDSPACLKCEGGNCQYIPGTTVGDPLEYCFKHITGIWKGIRYIWEKTFLCPLCGSNYLSQTGLAPDLRTSLSANHTKVQVQYSNAPYDPGN